MHVGFIDLEKVYDRFNRETLWQVLIMYGVGNNFVFVFYYGLTSI